MSPNRFSYSTTRMKNKLPWAKSVLKSIVFLGVAYLGLSLWMSIPHKKDPQPCISFRDQELRGRVDTVFMERFPKDKRCRIKFIDGTTYLNPLFFPNLEYLLQKEDSIYKPKGRFAFLRLENGKWKEIINLDTLDCNNL